VSPSVAAARRLLTAVGEARLCSYVGHKQSDE